MGSISVHQTEQPAAVGEAEQQKTWGINIRGSLRAFCCSSELTNQSGMNLDPHGGWNILDIAICKSVNRWIWRLGGGVMSGIWLPWAATDHNPSKLVTLKEVHGDDLWSVITPGEALERRDHSSDLERSKAPKDHHCVAAASHWL